MIKKISIFFILTYLAFFAFKVFYLGEKSNKPLYVAPKTQTLAPFPKDESTQKIIKRNELQGEAYTLARKSFYEEAIIKYYQAIAPSLLNYDYEKSTALAAIRDIHERQGKFELALEEHQWFLDAYEKNPFFKDRSGRYANTTIDKKLELEALIKARDTKSNQPIYDHIKYLRNKYKKYIPPQSKGDSGFHILLIEDIIHLYDWMGDVDGGIKFMEEVLSSKSLYPDERKKYEIVKAAFEEDKHTGQKGHLKKVIEASNIISW